MKTTLYVTIAALSLTLAFDASAKQPKAPKFEFDQNVTPDVIFGSGNSNGFFTTGRKNGVEVGLRAKLRYPIPNDTTNWGNSDGTYTFNADARAGTFTTPIWSFDWSVNTDYLGTSGQVLSDFIYELGMDSDPSSKTDYTVFDNISPSLVVPMWDHSLGNNTTTSATDVSDVTLTYGTTLGGYNVAQNSWNYEFFNNLGTSLEFFDPTLPGEYTIYLKVKDPIKGKTVAESIIHVLTY